jgi:hypothetical protein
VKFETIKYEGKRKLTQGGNGILNPHFTAFLPIKTRRIKNSQAKNSLA